MKRYAPWIILLALLALAAWLWLGRRTPPAVADRPDAPAEKQDQKRPYSPPRRLAEQAQDLAAWEEDPEGALSLSGRVVDEQGRPVVGAQVAISAVPPRTTTSGEDGVFSFDALNARTYWLEARAEDRVGSAQALVSAEELPVTITLQPGASYKVTVLDALDRHPILGARVSVGFSLKQEVLTDAQGTALLRGLSERGVLVVQAEGYGPFTDFENFGTPNGAPKEREILMTPGAGVSGVVLDPTGQPVAEARISYETLSAGFRFIPDDLSVTSDAQGKWSLPALSAGTYSFSASHDEYALGTSASVVLDGKTATEGVEIRLAPGATLSGRVLDASGQPVAGAAVSALQDNDNMRNFRRAARSAYSDAQGVYTIGGLPRAPHYASASAELGTSDARLVDLSSGSAEADLSITATGVIEGVVVSSRGEPLPDHEVFARRKGPFTEFRKWGAQGFLNAVTDADGRFQVRGVPADQLYVLSASAPGNNRFGGFFNGRGRGRGGEEPPEAKAGDTAVRLVVEDKGALTGKVVFEDGSTPEKFSVSTGFRNETTFSTPDGSFSLDKLEPGALRVTIGGPFAPKTLPDVTIKPGETTDLGTISLDPGRSVSGTVRDESGAIVAGAKVIIGDQVGGNGSSIETRDEYRSAISDAEGRYIIRGFSLREGLVIADHAGVGRSDPMPLGNSDGNTVLDLVLRPVGALEGVVTYAGAPVEAAVSAHPGGADPRNGFFLRSGDDGFFRFDRLAPGKYLLDAARQSSFTPGLSEGQKTVSVTIKAGVTTRADIEIPKGVTLLVTVSGGDGKAIVVQLIRGAVTASTVGELRDKTSKMQPDAARSAFMPPNTPGAFRFEAVASGDYTLCIQGTPFRFGAPPPPREERDALPVSCQPVTITPAPDEQSLSTSF